MEDRVAVLLATYNGASYLEEQILSITEQKNVSIDIYVRDDGSKDSTVDMLNGIAQHVSGIHILPSKTEPLGPCRNFFSILTDLDLSPYDYIAYCDQDDKWLPEKLIHAITSMKENGADCYGSDLLIWDGEKITGRILKSTAQTEYDFLFESASAGCTYVLAKSSFGHLQKVIRDRFDEIERSSSHDWFTYAITRIAGYRWVIDKQSHILYRQHAANQYGANIGFAGIKKIYMLFRSGWYRNNILLLCRLFYPLDQRPSFVDEAFTYTSMSFFRRLRFAKTVSRYRRKPMHRVFLFCAIIFKIF